METLEEYLKAGVSAFHVVEKSKKMLKKNGYIELDWTKEWELKEDGNYMTSPFDSMLFAFHMGKKSIRIATAHTDSPTFKVKPSPFIMKKSGMVVNVDKYGGMVYSNFMDRPLGLAGKVVCKGESAFSPVVKLWDSKKPVGIIPSLAIHMNREANEKNAIKVQSQMLPLIGSELIGKKKDEHEAKDYFMEYLAKELSCKAEDILDYDLYFYNTESPTTVGILDEYLMSPKLDNLTSCYSIVKGLCTAKESEHMIVTALFDNEEIGSRTKQGADSLLFRELLERIMSAKKEKKTLATFLKNGFLLSLDVAHGCHPNYEEKSDPTTITKLGGGVVIKASSTGKYSGDCESMAMLLGLCKEKKIKVQRQINHSDILGGSTLGPIATAYLPMPGADVGIPILAMHSAMECGAKKDIEELDKFVQAYMMES